MPKTTDPCTVFIDGLQCVATTEVLTFCRYHWQQQNRGASFTPRRPRRARHLFAVRDEHGRKQCARCEEWQSLELYGPSKSTGDNLQSWCKPCCVDYALLTRYGLTRAEVTKMVAEQGGCAICGTNELATDHRNGWHVDHDHACCPGDKTCGECVRGVLCSRCNKLLGLAKDEPSNLISAAQYLSRCQAKHEKDEA